MFPAAEWCGNGAKPGGRGQEIRVRASLVDANPVQ